LPCLIALHSQACIVSWVLAAKFVVWVHLFLILFFEVEKAIKFLVVEGHLDDFHGYVLRAIVLRAFDDVVSASKVLPEVALHAVDAKSVAAILFAEILV
jgi:hypothetical protein